MKQKDVFTYSYIKKLLVKYLTIDEADGEVKKGRRFNPRKMSHLIVESADRNASLGKVTKQTNLTTKMQEFDSNLKKKMHKNLRRKLGTIKNQLTLDISNFKLKKKQIKKGVKLEQLSKEAEIFILKSKKRRFTQEDLARFLRDIEIRQELNDIDHEKTLNESSIFTKVTIEDRIKDRKQENALKTYEEVTNMWEQERREIAKR